MDFPLIPNYDQLLNDGIKTSLFDGQFEDSAREYQIHLLTNDKSKNLKVITDIEEELKHCDSFDISVAFVTLAGIEALKSTFDEIRERNKNLDRKIKGRLLTTDYLTFSDPVALRFLDALPNLEVRMYRCDKEGFHTKGYIFSKEQDDLCRIIIGSSNLTTSALTSNREWNVKLVSKKEGSFAKRVQTEFNEYWDKALPLANVISQYEKEYHKAQRLKKAIALQAQSLKEELPLSPNEMQQSFVESCLELYERGQKRGLLISATGTGKTFAAAFAAQALKPKSILFVVHREQIAASSKKSFERVLGRDSYQYGLFAGNKKEYQANCLFSTVQSICKDETLNKFSKDQFDLIIIDEVHHAGADSYQKIINYFTPRFCLGMTATPERMDGFNIFELFNYNIAYEIRLQTAMEQDLLCPFHYFGITDIVYKDDNGDDLIEPISSKMQKVTPQTLKGINALASAKRVDYILEKAKFYGYSGTRVKGLVFCQQKQGKSQDPSECELLALKFRDRGYRTMVLSGADPYCVREKAIERLQTDDPNVEPLDYIFSVDVFNEGIDIPKVNQIIMLRPTQSPTIFLQQLGRGLRKADGKDFVVVLDFIGNYDNNYLISVALSGDKSYNKDNMRRFTSAGAFYIPGASSIHFDAIAQKKIFASIEKAKTSDIALLKISYQNLKYRLGHIPRLQDFVIHNEIDPVKFFENKNLGSYYTFLKKYEDEYTAVLPLSLEHILSYCCEWFGRGHRVTDVLLLEGAIKGECDLEVYVRRVLKDEYGLEVPPRGFDSAFKILKGDFFANTTSQEANADCVLFEFNDDEKSYKLTDYLRDGLEQYPEFKYHIEELISFVKERFKSQYRLNKEQDTDLSLNQKYSRADVCKLLNLDKNYQSVMFGYRYDDKSKTLPVFITYSKEDKAIQYEDHFINETTLIALSKRNQSVDSSDADHIYKRTAADRDNKIYLFVQRSQNDKEEKKYFYYLGKMNAEGEPKATLVHGNNKELSAFKITYHLEQAVDPVIYKFLTGDN